MAISWVQLRLEPSFHKELKRVAAERGVSLHRLIVVVLERFLSSGGIGEEDMRGDDE